MISYRLPDNLGKELQEFKILIEKYQRDEIDKILLKTHRVPFGVYEQREDNIFMIRVRCAAGIISPSQLEKIAKLSSEYGSGLLHITTRQEIQIHNIKLEHIAGVIKELKEIGLTTRGGGGNTVRNITASADSGISREEIFDVSPYAVALTSRFISEGDSWALPRKFKIAFSNSGQDTASASVNDLGFIARIENGLKGFRVYAAGGMGAKSSLGRLLLDFIPENEVYAAAVAVKSIFNKHGNRKNRNTARLRFLYDRMGEGEFNRLFTQEFDKIKKQGFIPLDIAEIKNTGCHPGILKKGLEDIQSYELWKKRYVRIQKQEGLFSITVPVILGVLTYEKTLKLSAFLKDFGDNVIRFTLDQNIHLRNIPEEYLSTFYGFLRELFDEVSFPPFYGNIISCAGASTCRLGICLSRGAAGEIMRKLKKSRLDMDKAKKVTLHISGCPNSCGAHLLGDIGLYGFAARSGERLYPAYVITSGAAGSDGKTRFSEKIGEISARDVPELIMKIMENFIGRYGEYSDFSEYIEKHGRRYISHLLDSKFSSPPTFAENKNYYFDWDSEEVFSLAGRGAGECYAGLLDFIERDFNEIEKGKIFLTSAGDSPSEKEKAFYSILFHSARMLLITQGIEAGDDRTVFLGFKKYFIESGFFSPDKAADYSRLIEEAAAGKRDVFLTDREESILSLARDVMELYRNMDDSLSFKKSSLMEAQPGVKKTLRPGLTDGRAQAKYFKDLRGVACPMNFVKTKMELSKMNKGEVLEIWLSDGEPINNVPGSVISEGHTILKQERIEGFWSVIIKK